MEEYTVKDLKFTDNNDILFKPKNFLTGEIELSPEELADLNANQSTSKDPLEKTPSTSNSAQQLPKESVDKFGSAEHMYIGDVAFSEFWDSIIEDKDKLDELITYKLCKKISVQNAYNRYIFTLPESNSIEISAGEIIALAGDFYADADHPICLKKEEMEQNFLNAYNTLIKANKDQINRLLIEINKETEVIQHALDNEQKSSIELAKIENEQNKSYAKVFSATSRFSFFPFTLLRSPYVKLATNNFDHFGDDAKAVHEVGHNIAVAMASKAAKMPTPKERAKGLLKAFTIELYACHFLTDIFASGHLRTPRKALWEQVTQNSNIPFDYGKSVIAGLLAKEMHDEDGETGVYVKSQQNPNGWKTFGDGCYFNDENEENEAQINETVKAALRDVFNAYLGKTLSEENKVSYKKYLPMVDETKVEEEDFAHPLFKVEDGKVKVRKEVNNIHCTQYEDKWSPTATLLERKLKTITNVTESIRNELKDEFEEIYNDDSESKYACKIS